MEPINGDSANYEVLVECAKAIKGIEGMTCELGTRMGYGSLLIMQSCNENEDPRIHVGIDPYGNILYEDAGGKHYTDYTNQMKNNFLAQIYAWCYENNQQFIFFNMTDEMFFIFHKYGIPYYDTEEQLLNKYALVHLDGPHTSKYVLNEIEFFQDKMDKGAIIICDDIDQYPHDSEVEPEILKYFDLFKHEGRKKAYIKK